MDKNEQQKRVGSEPHAPVANPVNQTAPAAKPSNPTLLEFALTEVVGFHVFGNERCARVKCAKGTRTLPVDSKEYRDLLSGAFKRATGRLPTTRDLRETISELHHHMDGLGVTDPVAVRVAARGDSVWVDLANPERQVIQVSARGIEIRDDIDCPVAFLRAPGMGALPLPVEGGTLDEIGRFVRVRDDVDLKLLQMWILGAFLPMAPCPVLFLSGGAGCGKSLAAHYLTGATDPRIAASRQLTSGIDLATVAASVRVLSFENVSKVSRDQSDTLCAIVTGTGVTRRQLYTNSGVSVLPLKCCVLMNGINPPTEHLDLNDRMFDLQLPPMERGERSTIDRLEREFEEARGRIFGATLRALQAALANFETADVPDLTRLADFQKYVTAAEPALGWAPGTTAQVLAAYRDRANQAAIEASPVGAAVVEYVNRHGGFRGTPTELLEAVHSLGSGPLAGRDLPKTPRQLSQELNRLAVNLAAAGYLVGRSRKNDEMSSKLITIGKFHDVTEGAA